MGRVQDSTELSGKGTHFTWDERLKLESYLQGKGRFPKLTRTKELGIRLEKNQRTIKREIKRGMVEHQHSDLHYFVEYNADYANNAAKYEGTAKRSPLVRHACAFFSSDGSFPVSLYFLAVFSSIPAFNALVLNLFPSDSIFFNLLA